MKKLNRKKALLVLFVVVLAGIGKSVWDAQYPRYITISWEIDRKIKSEWLHTTSGEDYEALADKVKEPCINHNSQLLGYRVGQTPRKDSSDYMIVRSICGRIEPEFIDPKSGERVGVHWLVVTWALVKENFMSIFIFPIAASLLVAWLITFGIPGAFGFFWRWLHDYEQMTL